MPFKAPFLRYEDLRRIAETFLAERHPTRTIPVPIEEIIELQFGMDIVPVPGLDNFDVVAYLSQDMTEIRVDEAVHKDAPARYRFSLAHELAHKLLHEDIFRELKFTKIQGWKKLISDTIPEDQYGYLEFQANSLAALILVPSAELEKAFQEYMSKAKGVSFEGAENPARYLVERHIARTFQVSPAVVHRRIEADDLW